MKKKLFMSAALLIASTGGVSVWAAMSLPLAPAFGVPAVSSPRISRPALAPALPKPAVSQPLEQRMQTFALVQTQA